MDEIATAKRRVAIYLALTAILSGLSSAVIIAVGSLGKGRGFYTFALMWSPGAAALIAGRLTAKDPRELGWTWSWRWALWAVAIPLAYSVIAYVPVWLSPWGGFPNPTFVEAVRTQFGFKGWPAAAVIAAFFVLISTLGVIRSAVSALGEEIGWRGFLVPELLKWMPFWKASAVSAVAWTLFHVPILLFADYNAGTPKWFALSCFTAQVFVTCPLYTWSRLRSGSLWPAAILHAAHNAVVQQFFTPMTVDTGRTKWIIDEFGVALVVSMTLVMLAAVRPSAAPAEHPSLEPRNTP